MPRYCRTNVESPRCLREHQPLGRITQTADVRDPEPRPAVELPILRNNALVPRPGSSGTRLPCRRRSGSWPTVDLHYGVYLANPRARAALTSLECGACSDWTR